MNGKKIFGILLVVIGVFLLLGETGIIDITIRDIISGYWPLILVVIGLYKLFTNSISKITGIILIIIGILLQLKVSEYFNIFEYDLFWPIVIILLGIWILLFYKRDRWKVSSKDVLSAFALFSGFNIKNSSQSFKGGNITSIFGGVEVDLREASILKEQEARIDILIAFGGAEIFVPQGWNVVIKGTPIFGGWENKTVNNNFDTNSPTLIINSFVMFGGFEVKN
ncbi:LiaF transmembrane domain-containing protein [Caloranaerobacter ferrireducens]|uniref:LiaF transmembrane domain-containing protein n=1 Tax=Caloranaerobacter ferrireducens TaxID=1323370 RepID=UPI00084CECBA|nr:DUF5668 domain-containing protein [Caloranaerobacter ferrireducens]